MLSCVVVNNNPSLRSIERTRGGEQKTKTSNIRTGLDELDKTRQTLQEVIKMYMLREKVNIL